MVKKGVLKSDAILVYPEKADDGRGSWLVVKPHLGNKGKKWIRGKENLADYLLEISKELKGDAKW